MGMAINESSHTFWQVQKILAQVKRQSIESEGNIIPERIVEAKGIVPVGNTELSSNSNTNETLSKRGEF